jgi:hypothetical protein
VVNDFALLKLEDEEDDILFFSLQAKRKVSPQTEHFIFAIPVACKTTLSMFTRAMD